MSAQTIDFNMPDIDPVKQNFALLYIVVATQQRQYRSLTATCRAHKCNSVVCLNAKTYVFKYPLAFVIREPNVFKFDIALDFFQLYRVGFVRHVRFNIQNRKNLLCRSKCRLQSVELLRQTLNRVKKAGYKHIKRHYYFARYNLSQEFYVI